jgi:hypothetical protein
MRIAIRVLAALLPLLLTPALAYVLAEGDLNLGGGEKDIIVIVPWAFGSVVYGVTFFILWNRRIALGRSTVLSIAVAFAALLVAAVILALISHLGVLGRF